MNEWQERTIGEVCHKVTSGGTPSRRTPDFYISGSVAWVKTQELLDCWIEDTEEHITDAAVKNSSAKILPANTVLLAMYGATVGQLGILRRPMACNQASCAMIVDENKADFRFFYYQLYYRRSELKRLATGAAQQNLSGQMLKTYRLFFPPLDEQEAIADVLGALDDKIELNRRMNETLESMARALFQSWFVDFDPVRARMEGRQPLGMDAETAALFPCAFADSPLGQVPSGWAVEPIGNCVRVVGGGTPSTGNTAFWEGGDIHWATPKDLSLLANRALLDTERKITRAGLKQIGSGLLPQGTVLMSSRAPIGYLAVAEVPVAINQGFIAMVCDGPLPNHYVLNWAEANMDTIKGRANGTTFLEISKANFRPIPVVVPPKSVLDKFLEQAESLHRKMVNNLEQSKTLETIRDALLPKLMSGEVRVRDVEKTVETYVT